MSRLEKVKAIDIQNDDTALTQMREQWDWLIEQAMMVDKTLKPLDKAVVVGYSDHIPYHSVVTVTGRGEAYQWLCWDETTGRYEGFNEKDLLKLP